MRYNPLLWALLLLMLSTWLTGAALDPLVLPGQPMISVGITGYTERPGIYRFGIDTRLSDALDMLRADPELITPPVVEDITAVRTPALVDTIPPEPVPPSNRQILIRRDNVSSVYDLTRFTQWGEMEHNPLLKDGDVIIIKPVEHTVTISGAVVRPDEFEYLLGDELDDLLAFAGGFKAEADLRNVLLYRYDEDMIRFETIKLDLSAYNKNAAVLDIPLQAGDRVMIPVNSLFRRGWKVTVKGHVHSPGEYLISEETTLYDILRQCGGPTAQGDLAAAFVINYYIHGKPDPDIERLKNLAINAMTPMEYNYLRTKLRQMRGKYSINVEQNWESKGALSNPLMRNGDVIYVPERLDMVWVSGQVRYPGLVPYVEGKNWQEYINDAGGYTNNRKFRGVRIIRSHSGNWVMPDRNIRINPGDIIFVAERTDRDIWLDIRDVVLLSSQLITILIGIRALTIRQ